MNTFKAPLQIGGEPLQTGEPRQTAEVGKKSEVAEV